MWKIILIVSLTLCFVEADLNFKLTGKDFGNNKENRSPSASYVKIFHVNARNSMTSLSQTSSSYSPNIRNPYYNGVFTTKYRAGEKEKLLFQVFYKFSRGSDQKVGEGTLLLDEFVKKNGIVEVVINGVGKLLVKKY